MRNDRMRSAQLSPQVDSGLLQTAATPDCLLSSFLNQWTNMKDFNDKNFGQRLIKAQQARQAMLQRAQKPAADDPVVLERKAEREAIVAARDARNEAKARAALELAARQEAERIEQDAIDKRKAREEADRAVASQAEQKAMRDARYAARKKRKA
jgi:hypothetical protein